MSNTLTLDIAALRYIVHLDPEFEAVEAHSLYQDFINRSTPGVDALEVPVQIKVADPRPPESWPVVFDNNETWLALHDGDDLVLAFRSPVDPDEWWWSARLEAGGPKVTVICDPEIVDERDGLTRIVNPLRYPLDQMLTMFILANRGGCILHAAGLTAGDRGVAFVGRSGAGKTTLMSVIEPRPDIIRLSDDRVILQVEKRATRIYGTPWAGEGMVAANANTELTAIVLLHHSSENRLEPIESFDAARQLLPTTSIPWFDTDYLTGCFETLDRIVTTTPCYNLHFRPDRDVTDVVSVLF